ncbi:MAG: hypothetical protein QW067_11155 [Thermofilaceae archaeon]
MKDKIIQQGLLELIRKNRMCAELLAASKNKVFHLPSSIRTLDYPYALKAVLALELLNFVKLQKDFVHVLDYKALRNFFKSKEYLLLFAEITIRRTLPNAYVERIGKSIHVHSPYITETFSLDNSGIKLLHPQKVKKLLKHNKPINGLNILYLKRFLEYVSGQIENPPKAILNVLQLVHA